MVRRLPLIVVGSLLATWGCDSKPATPPVSEAAASASAALEAAKKAAAEKIARKVIKRAKNEADLVLTPERRSKLESAAPETKGFLDQREELEPKLFKQELKRGANDTALKAFDKLAKGKYVLFSGYIIDPKPEGFDLAVRYTPRDPADPVGLTATWFPVHFTQVKGYDVTAYKGGEPIAVLAKYEGAQVATSARDLISLEEWF
jgi:hypothetical protein